MSPELQVKALGSAEPGEFVRHDHGQDVLRGIVVGCPVSLCKSERLLMLLDPFAQSPSSLMGCCLVADVFIDHEVVSYGAPLLIVPHAHAVIPFWNIQGLPTAGILGLAKGGRAIRSKVVDDRFRHGFYVDVDTWTVMPSFQPAFAVSSWELRLPFEARIGTPPQPLFVFSSGA